MQIIRSVVRLGSATALTLAGFLFIATPASAEIYGFACITGNDAGDCAILQDQMWVEVTAGADNMVSFQFWNTGPEASSTTEIYFSDLLPALLGLPASISSSSGVSFTQGCNPGNLPGGNDYGFTTSYCGEPTAPSQLNGVNPGEWLSVAYTLQGSYSFADVIAAINSGDYRVGIRVQGYASGGSEAGLLTGVPEPSALMFLGTGLLLTPVVRRFRRRS